MVGRENGFSDRCLPFPCRYQGLKPVSKRERMQRRIANDIIGLICIIGTLLLFSPCAKSDQRFTDNGDGTITDHQLGVMWAKNANQGDIGWKQAEAYARQKFGQTVDRRYANWRLPTLDELQSLYVTATGYNGYRTDCGIQVRIVPQIRLSCILVWSSDVALGSHMAFNYNIGNPFAVQSYDVSGCRVLPVRNLE